MACLWPKRDARERLSASKRVCAQEQPGRSALRVSRAPCRRGRRAAGIARRRPALASRRRSHPVNASSFAAAAAPDPRTRCQHVASTIRAEVSGSGSFPAERPHIAIASRLDGEETPVTVCRFSASEARGMAAERVRLVDEMEAPTATRATSRVAAQVGGGNAAAAPRCREGIRRQNPGPPARCNCNEIARRGRESRPLRRPHVVARAWSLIVPRPRTATAVELPIRGAVPRA
jgi:hypothetical protein